MALPQIILPHYTYDDWVHWEGVWELIEGHPIAMSPTPIPAHQRVVAEIITQLTLALRSSNCKHCKVYDSLDYKILEDTILVPDVLIICGDITKKYLDFPPALVVEILSPSSALRDRHIKHHMYEQQGVNYYLIADPDAKSIEVFELRERNYQLIENDVNYHLMLHDECTITARFSKIFD